MASTAFFPISPLPSSISLRLNRSRRLPTAPSYHPTSGRRLRYRLCFAPRSTSSDQGSGPQPEEQPPVSEQGGDPSRRDPERAEEIRKVLAEARARARATEDQGFWGGVAEEVGKIEWPVMGKMLGTTGVVLSVIIGATIALLTVNAVLAEISDRVFAGRGVQDFFS